MTCDGCGHDATAHTRGHFRGCRVERCYCTHLTNAVAEQEYREWIEASGMST